jgi:hypothetical protein
MPAPPEHWTVRQLTLANPKGRRQGDLPRLLRAVADELERVDAVEVFDLVVHSEPTGRGPWYSVTAYCSVPDDAE